MSGLKFRCLSCGVFREQAHGAAQQPAPDNKASSAGAKKSRAADAAGTDLRSIVAGAKARIRLIDSEVKVLDALTRERVGLVMILDAIQARRKPKQTDIDELAPDVKPRRRLRAISD